MSRDQTERQAILVLGMHRSGTSALTRVLGLLGAELPERLMPPIPGNNDAGFWEPIDIVGIHDELLADAGSRWDDISSLPRAWFRSAAAASYRGRLASALHANYGDAPLLVVKDPRICRFVPLWVDLLHEVGIVPHFTIPIRNPLEVADSLKKRDGFPVAKSALLWLRHALDAERDTRNHPRSFCSYDDLLNDWRRVVDRIASDLGVIWPRDGHRAAAEIERFLSRSHRHNALTRDQLACHSQINRWVRDAYDALEQAARGHLDNLVATLDAIRDELDHADQAFGPVVADAECRRAAELEAPRVAELEAALGASQARAAELEAALGASQARAAELEAALGASQARAAELEAALGASQARVAELEEQARGLQARADSLEATVAQQRLEREQLADQVAAREHEAEVLSEQLAERDRTLAELRAEVESLRLHITWLDSEVASRDSRIEALWAEAERRGSLLNTLQEQAGRRAGLGWLSRRAGRSHGLVTPHDDARRSA